MTKIIKYDQSLREVEQSLFWLNKNARHAIECHETFSFPAYNASIRKLIKGTQKVRCYKICLEAIYIDFIMTLMRIYDNYERDTVSFKKLFDHLTDDFIKNFENQTHRQVKSIIQSSRNEFKNLKGSHFVGRLKTVRHNMIAHTSTNFNRNQIANYGDAEKLLDKTLPMLNNLNSAIRDKTEPYDKIRKYWKGYAIEFWRTMLKENGPRQAK